MFATCRDLVPYKGYYHACATDMCTATTEDEMKAIRCKYVEAMAYECGQINLGIPGYAAKAGGGMLIIVVFVEGLTLTI